MDLDFPNVFRLESCALAQVQISSQTWENQKKIQKNIQHVFICKRAKQTVLENLEFQNNSVRSWVKLVIIRLLRVVAYNKTRNTSMIRQYKFLWRISRISADSIRPTALEILNFRFGLSVRCIGLYLVSGNSIFFSQMCESEIIPEVTEKKSEF